MQKAKYYNIYMIKRGKSHNIIIKLNGMDNDLEADNVLKSLQYFLEDFTLPMIESETLH